MKLYEALYTIFGTAGITLLFASAYLGDIYEFTILSGTFIVLSGLTCALGMLNERHKREVHFREKMEELRLKKY